MPAVKESPNASIEMMDAFIDGISIFGNLISATQAYWAGISRYTTDFCPLPADWSNL